ncbi:hypothetical protein DSO57_1037378 [Entomophthora muscae]|uniref:Uncharacterized protein n=1 Tax=Entomophthora muscae TaxID=34485 RepID=A0ACC2T9U6_9FUNG|nr:hypothetical protein DSO57_1037378 [Entomophthora muscae]
MVEDLFQVVMFAGLSGNVIALWVILRQDTHQLDLRLALVMSICDLMLVIYKLGEAIFFHAVGSYPATLKDGQWQGVITTFLLQLSAVSVGFLAILRFWVICLKQKVNLRVWWTMFVFPQVVVLGFLIEVAYQGHYELAQSMYQFYPAINTGNWVVECCRAQLLLSFVWPVVAVNISYPYIAWIYGSSLQGLRSYEAYQNQSKSVYIKIAGFVLVYNLIMLPSLLVLIMEEITGSLQSPFLESAAVVALFSMTFFNPFVLLVLHHDSFIELKALVRQIKSTLQSNSAC